LANNKIQNTNVVLTKRQAYNTYITDQWATCTKRSSMTKINENGGVVKTEPQKLKEHFKFSHNAAKFKP